MRQKHALALGFSAAAVLASFGFTGVGCSADTTGSSSGSGPTCLVEDEVCDGQDNNCDGVVDEGCDCLPAIDGAPAETQGCYSGPEGTNGKGQCKGGTQTCDATGAWGPCETEVLPAADDACDGLDNNCDGMVDETCECSPPVPETTQPCFTGDPATKDVGACHGGLQSCLAGGTWDVVCTGEVVSSAETCDSIDNDCNGVADDMGTTTCGVGACQVTVVTCENGQTNACITLDPSKEICDGIDNDCDQLTDENFPNKGLACTSPMPGVCAPGTYSCLSGVETCVPTLSPTVEKCDSLDNDCDGVVDDNIAGTGGMCSTGLPGVCDPGSISCQNGTIDCFSLVDPSPEVCDGLDNDCNGQADEGNPQGGAACDTGTPGLCQQGTEKCINATIQCIPDAAAQPETCDGVDNNCDGQVDENNPGGGINCSTGLQGACAQGIKNCQAGALVCTPNVMPVAETCDGTDNDCNGVVDDNNPGGGAVCSTGLQGVCAAGTITCQGGLLSCKQNVQPVAEICGNGLDDNCDGQADPPVVVYFTDDFVNNSKGWTLDANWSIGPTVMSAATGSCGLGDPAADHSPSADNGVAGNVLGGNVSQATGPVYYMTSPIIDTSAAPTLYLEYWRWLHSDYPPFMVDKVEVYNGSVWTAVYNNPGSVVNDQAWTKLSHDITAYKSAQMRVRFSYQVGSSGAYLCSGWNVDDIQIVNVPCN